MRRVKGLDGVYEFKCPNCWQTHNTEDNGYCLLAVLVSVVHDRGDVSMEALAKVAEEADDSLWDRFGGPAADWLEDRAREAQERMS